MGKHVLVVYCKLQKLPTQVYGCIHNRSVALLLFYSSKGFMHTRYYSILGSFSRSFQHFLKKTRTGFSLPGSFDANANITLVEF